MKLEVWSVDTSVSADYLEDPLVDLPEADFLTVLVEVPERESELEGQPGHLHHWARPGKGVWSVWGPHDGAIRALDYVLGGPPAVVA